MKKNLLMFALSIIFSTNIALAMFPQLTFTIANTGSQSLYYALSYTKAEYNEILCATVNGIGIKKNVTGEIFSGTPVVLNFVTEDNYVELCRGTELLYNVSFGLYQSSAIYNENDIYINSEFNTGGIYDNLEWAVKSAGSPAITSAIQPDGTTIFYVNSDSSYFHH